MIRFHLVIRIGTLALLATFGVLDACVAQETETAPVANPNRVFRAARYQEDWSFLADPSKRTDRLDGLKYLKLNDEGDAYLTLNGEIRFRYDYTERKNFFVAPSATISKTGVIKFARPTAPIDSELLKQRYFFGSDWHLGPHFRVYAEIAHAEQSGHGAGASVPASQRNDLALINGFGEFSMPIEGGKLGLQAGRQEVFFGNNHQVAANVATSLPDPVFDGARLFADWAGGRIDVFGYNAYKYADSTFGGSDNPHRNLWGVYGAFTLPSDGDFKPKLDAFYFGFRARPNNNGAGTGAYNDRALVNGPTVSATKGFVLGSDLRHTLGVRVHGAAGAVTWDDDIAIQRGEYAGRAARAWAFNTDTGYTFANTPWRPRIGTHVDGASGGANATHVFTYQPMLPDTLYYLPNSFFTPTNFYDVSPRVTVHPTADVSAEFYYAFLWRNSLADAVYTGNWKGANGTNAFAVSALGKGRAIGQMPNLTVTWLPVEYVTIRVTLAELFPGPALKSVLATPTTYVNAQATLRF